MIRSRVGTEDLKIEVRLTPRAARDEVVGWRGRELACRVRAAPVDGKANEALRRLLAKRLGVARGRVRLLRGARSRSKLIAVEGAPADARERLGG